jgi:hypothetical protein
MPFVLHDFVLNFPCAEWAYTLLARKVSGRFAHRQTCYHAGITVL